MHTPVWAYTYALKKLHMCYTHTHTQSHTWVHPCFHTQGHSPVVLWHCEGPRFLLHQSTELSRVIIFNNLVHQAGCRMLSHREQGQESLRVNHQPWRWTQGEAGRRGSPSTHWSRVRRRILMTREAVWSLQELTLVEDTSMSEWIQLLSRPLSSLQGCSSGQAYLLTQPLLVYVDIS